MTVLEALPRDSEGQIPIPVAGKDELGNVYSGTTSPEFIQAVFPDHANLPVPLTDDQFASLLAVRPGLWEENWQAFRAQGII